MTIFLFFFIPFMFFLVRGFRKARRARHEAEQAEIRKAEYDVWMEDQRQLARNKAFTDVGLDWQKTDRELDIPNDLFLPRPEPVVTRRRK